MFLNVLEAGFGSDKAVSATIYSTEFREPLPVQLIAIHLDWPGRKRIIYQHLEEKQLLDELVAFTSKSLQPS